MEFPWFELVLILVLIIANGFFAASEIAIVSSRRGRLEQAAENGQRGATVALELADDPSRFLSTVQVGITLLGTFASVFGGSGIAQNIEERLLLIPAVALYAEGLAATVVALAISYLSLIIGELAPKRLALQNAERVASTVAPFMRQLARIGAPVVSFLTFSTGLVLRLFGQHKATDTPVTEEDILALVREGAAEGTVAASEKDLIRNVFTFSDRSVRSLMTPRTQIVAAEVDTPVAEILRTIVDSGYSRMPIFAETLDHVVGMLYVKDMLHAWGDPASVNVRALLRPPLFVLEGQRAATVFAQLKQQRSAIAMVLDEYGQVAGVVSMEDMIEELVGDIADEYDDHAENLVRREDGSYLADGMIPFTDLAERLALPDANDLVREHGFETLAGFLLALLGHIPAVGAITQWRGYVFEVVDMDARRIDRVLITPPAGAD